MRTEVVQVATSEHVTDLTDVVSRFCHGLGDGLCHVFAPHATAGVGLMELGSGSEDDLSELLLRLMPRDDRYSHHHGSRGHGADHILPTLVSPSLIVPVIAGVVTLGTWQSVVLIDLNRDNPRRQIRLSFVAG